MYFVYVIKALKPSKKKYYIGVSSNLLRRLKEHNSLFNTGYTRNNKWKILYIKGYINKFTAYERERQLKHYGNVWYHVMKRIREQEALE